MLHCTVLVPSFARPDHLGRCLVGIEAQTRTPDEVIVVLQRADEPSWDVLRAHPWVHGVVVDRPGVVAALNAGFDALDPSGAEGIVAILDDDATPRAQWLERIESWFVSDALIGGVGGPDHPVDPAAVFDPVERVGRFRWFGRMEGFHERGCFAAHDVQFLKGANHAYRRCALGGRRLDEGLRGTGAQVHNDLDLTLAVWAAGWRQVFDPLVAVDHDSGPSPDRDLASRPPGRVYDAAVNKMVVLRRHLGLARAVSILPWELACGDGYSPGPWRLLRMRVRPVRALVMFLAATAGKVVGIVIGGPSPGSCPPPGTSRRDGRHTMP
jgi:GT2 family glycosyltransferase